MSPGTHTQNKRSYVCPHLSYYIRLTSASRWFESELNSRWRVHLIIGVRPAVLHVVVVEVLGEEGGGVAAAQELGKQCYLRCAPQPSADSSPAAVTDSPKPWPCPSIERFNAEVFAGSKIGDGPGFSGLPHPTHQITEASKAMH